MQSETGHLSGSGIRTLPDAKVEGFLKRLKVEQGRRFRVLSVRYRVTGFRDPGSGEWVARNPRNGQYYRVRNGRHRTQVRPTPEMLSRTDMLALEVEVDRGGPLPHLYYVSVPGVGR